MGRIERALISVSDKKGIVEFSRPCRTWMLRSFPPAARLLCCATTEFPSRMFPRSRAFWKSMDGRVKTLHPKVHGGILALRDNPEHIAKMKEHGIVPIDLVVVNLYPFEATVVTRRLSMRSSRISTSADQVWCGREVKNYQHVGVIVDPEDYSSILAELRQNRCSLSPATHFRLFCKAFQHTSHYGPCHCELFFFLDENKKPSPWGQTVNIQISKIKDMRYGENLHQGAAFYATQGETGPSYRGLNSFKARSFPLTIYWMPTRR